MLTRNDANGPELLHILTEECLALDSVLIRWYQISLSASGHWYLIGPNGGTSGQRANGNAQQSQSRQLFVNFFNLLVDSFLFSLCYLLCQELAVIFLFFLN